MKKLMILLFTCSMSYALNAPYLISATALSDTSAALTWRNNDAASTGFIVQRRDSTETVYHFVDSVKSATQLTYTDRKGLLPATLYTYQVIAYSATEVSDTSNSMQVTTLAGIFKAPKISLSVWNADTSKSLRISIIDSSNCETGYRVYRDENFASSFSLIAEIISANPKDRNIPITWIDSTVSYNSWHVYKVAAYKSNDSLFSNPCSTFTLHTVQPQQAVRFQKLSDFPVSDSGSWSAKAGDSIILKETNSPAGMFTVINVSNPANPGFAGYIDSTSALSYPLQTLIPVFINFGVSNSYTNTSVVCYGDRMLVARDGITLNSRLNMYRVVTYNLINIDSLSISDPGNLSLRKLNLLLFNDTVLGIQYFENSGTPNFNFHTVFLSSSGFSPLFIGYQQPMYIKYFESVPVVKAGLWRPYIHGIFNQSMFISCDYDSFYLDPIMVPHHFPSNSCKVYNISNNANDSLPVNMPYANAFNTGHCLSPTEILCTSGFSGGYPPAIPGGRDPGGIATELFVSDIRDLRPYSTALANNAIYRDTAHRQYQIQNIILDTVARRVYLMFTNNMTILSYQREPITGVAYAAKNPPSTKGIIVLPNAHLSGVTIVLPAHTHAADLYFYDLSGRVIDRMQGVTSNAVLWRPKTKSMRCYIVMVKNGSEKHTARFMVR